MLCREALLRAHFLAKALHDNFGERVLAHLARNFWSEELSFLMLSLTALAQAANDPQAREGVAGTNPCGSEHGWE